MQQQVCFSITLLPVIKWQARKLHVHVLIKKQQQQQKAFSSI